MIRQKSSKIKDPTKETNLYSFRTRRRKMNRTPRIALGQIFLCLIVTFSSLLAVSHESNSCIVTQRVEAIAHPPKPVPPLIQTDIIVCYESSKNQMGADIGEVIVSLGDTSLYVTYQTTKTQGHNWILSVAYIWLDTTPARNRGGRGNYQYNSGSINTTSYTFEIPLSELFSEFGISWNSLIYMMTRCEIYHDFNDDGEYDKGESSEIGFGYRFPFAWIGGQPWFAYFWFWLTPSSGSGCDEKGFSLKEPAHTSIKIYPVIAKRNSTVFIRHQIPRNEPTALEIYNSAGVLLKRIEHKVADDLFTLDTRNLGSGLYIIKVVSRTNHATGKLIIINN